MFRIEAKSNPRFLEAGFITILIIATMAYSIGYLKATPHIPIFSCNCHFTRVWITEKSALSRS